MRRVWEAISKTEVRVDIDPPADHPPSEERPTAAFHVGRWAVVIVFYYYKGEISDDVLDVLCTFALSEPKAGVSYDDTVQDDWDGNWTSW